MTLVKLLSKVDQAACQVVDADFIRETRSKHKLSAGQMCEQLGIKNKSYYRRLTSGSIAVSKQVALSVIRLHKYGPLTLEDVYGSTGKLDTLDN